jgi:hypothetical protein
MMRNLVRKFAVSVLLTAFLTQSSYAQPFPESDRQKAAEAHKRAADEATDEAYKAMMKNVPNVPNTNKKVDPWGSVRAPSVNSNK